MSDKNERLPALRRFLNFPVTFPWSEDDLWGFEDNHQSGLAVSEDKDHVYVEAHLPGLKPDNIEVTFEKGMLWIHGEKKEEEEDKKKKFYRKASSSFSYRVQVPGAVDEKKEPEATFKDGVMKISFSKAQDSQNKKIKIKSN
ncbi:MAG: Hsp20/alpha crystallin family protein [Chlamydiae bacterium]|nr:Hsp20/alpha crystallin family protein [Chlamydiota bacterium]